METQKALETLAFKREAKDVMTIPTSIHAKQNTMGIDNYKEIEQGKHSLLENIRTAIAAYRGALALNGVIIPIVASLTMAGIYLAHPAVWFFGIDPGTRWFPLVSSTIITGIIWMFAAFCVSFFTTAKTANAHGYGLLTSRLCQLKANLDIEDAAEALEQKKAAGIHRNEAALNDARTCYNDIRKLLSQSPTGMLWVSGTGYTNAWSLMHHAEEALIESQSIDEVIRGAIHDKLAIQGSTLSRKDELLDKLLQAVITLQPEDCRMRPASMRRTFRVVKRRSRMRRLLGDNVGASFHADAINRAPTLFTFHSRGRDKSGPYIIDLKGCHDHLR